MSSKVKVKYDERGSPSKSLSHIKTSFQSYAIFWKHASCPFSGLHRHRKYSCHTCGKGNFCSTFGLRTMLHKQATEKLHQLKKKVSLPCLWQSLLLTLNRNWAFLSKLAVWLIASNLVVWCWNQENCSQKSLAGGIYGNTLHLRLRNLQENKHKNTTQHSCLPGNEPSLKVKWGTQPCDHFLDAQAFLAPTHVSP